MKYVNQSVPKKEKPVVEGFLSWLEKHEPVRGSRIYKSRNIYQKPYTLSYDLSGRWKMQFFE